MKQKHLSIVGYGKKRYSKDYYPTPIETTMALMKREKFEGNIWECASGDGRMSKVLEQFNDVISSDIVNEDWIYGEKGIEIYVDNK